MPRLERLLTRKLTTAEKRGKLSPREIEAARKVLASEDRMEQFVTEKIVAMNGCFDACEASFRAKSDTPVRDWIKANWIKILAALVAFALSLI